MRRALAGIVALVISASLLAACSDDGPSSIASEPSTTTTMTAFGMTLTSPAFADGGTIPTEFTCAGAGSSPELQWSAPDGTKELALLVFDPDAGGNGFVHYLVWGIDPKLRGALSNQYPGGTPGMNSRGSEGWVPPCPPSGGPHRYQFTIFALSRTPEIAPTANVRQFLDGISNTVLSKAELTGTFGR